MKSVVRVAIGAALLVGGGCSSALADPAVWQVQRSTDSMTDARSVVLAIVNQDGYLAAVCFSGLDRVLAKVKHTRIYQETGGLVRFNADPATLVRWQPGSGGIAQVDGVDAQRLAARLKTADRVILRLRDDTIILEAGAPADALAQFEDACADIRKKPAK